MTRETAVCAATRPAKKEMTKPANSGCEAPLPSAATIVAVTGSSYLPASTAPTSGIARMIASDE